MSSMKNDEKNLKGRVCPVHGCSLQKYDTGAVDAWYCGKCDRYYLDPIFQSTAGRITILGKATSFFPQNELPKATKESEIQIRDRVPGGKNARLNYAEANLKSLPPTSETQFCPVHNIQIDTRIAVVSGENGWEKELPVGLCRDCAVLFTNDQAVAVQSSPSVFGVPVIWNPKVFQKYSDGKKKKPVFRKLSIELRNAPVHIQAKLQNKARNILTTAKNCIITPDGFKIVIQGQYSVRQQKFICTLQSYLEAVLPEYDSNIVCEDTYSLLKKARASKTKDYMLQMQKLLLERQEQVQKRKRLEQAALPYLCYTLPLLKGNTNQCPFCKNALVSDRVMRIAIYKDQKMDMTALQRGLYCPHCEVPFIDRTLEDQLLLKLKPKMIYVFDANACRTPRELLDRAKEKVLVRKPHKQNQAQTKPMNAPQAGIYQGKQNLPNLSYEPNTRVFVYAERCHCTACEKKYKRDTIQNRTALVETISHHMVQVTVQFCTGCGKYYMNLATFQQYCKRYGGILLECVIEPDLCRKNASWLNFNPDSILSRCGYSVREGISKEYRQAILAYILESKRATKHEILELVSGFIRLRQNRFPGACSRWEEDLLFVSQYQASKQTQVKGLTFRRAK